MGSLKKIFAVAAFLPCLAQSWTGASTVGTCGKVLGYKQNGPIFYFRIDSDPNSRYFLQSGRIKGDIIGQPTTVGVATNITFTDAQKIEIRNAERSAILQAYSLGESVCFVRESASSWGTSSTFFEVENISVGSIP